MAETVASYAELKRVEHYINQAKTVDDLRTIAATEGTKVGYRVLGRLIAGKTPEELKPSEAYIYDASAESLSGLTDNDPLTAQVDKCLSEKNIIPAGKKPYPYQEDGMRFLATNSAALLGDEMGLGKTIQAIGALKILFYLQWANRALILCPRPIVNQWYHELREWAPEIFAFEVRGSREKRRALWHSDARVFITSYETWRSDLSSGAVRRDVVDLLILDEIQKIKSPEAAITAAVRLIPAKYRWGLSGTPLVNRVDDVVAIYDTLNPSLFKGYEPPYQPGLVKRLIKPYFFRRRVEAVDLELPEKKNEDVWLELNDQQRDMYDRIYFQAKLSLEQSEARSIHVFQALNQLKQICNYDEQSETSSKLDYLLEKLETVAANGQKALIFSQFPHKTLAPIQSKLKKYKPLLFHGGISDNKTRRILDSFQNQRSSQVLLASVKSGGTGLNLTSANHVFHFDHWWNPAMALQAEGRAHRIGQERTVFIHSMFTSSTIEERIFQLLSEKQYLFNTVIDDLSQEEVMGSLTQKELYGLFDLEPPVRSSRKPKKRSGYKSTKTHIQLLWAQEEINAARSVTELRNVAKRQGSRIGYKTVCYLLGELSTPEDMKRD